MKIFTIRWPSCKMQVPCRYVKCRPAEVVKFVFAVVLGYSMHLFLSFDESEIQTCPPCPLQTVAQVQNCPTIIPRVQIRDAYRPKTMYEVLRFDYFSDKHMYGIYDDDPRIGLLGHQKGDIKDIITQAMTLYNSHQKTQWKFKHLHNGYRRYDPLRGEEYILDLEIYKAKEPLRTAKTEIRRMELVKPFSPAVMVQEVKVTKSTIINFILPITKFNQRFRLFMADYEKNCLKTKEAVNLIIILVMGKNSRKDVGVDEMEKFVTALKLKYKGSHMRIITTKKPFNRAFAMDLGARQVGNSALLFFCDIDVTITPQFLTRCRYNTALKKQVYFPGVFSQYDSELVKKYSPPDKIKNLMDINRHTGHWIYYGYGMVCLYKSDYLAVGGFDLNIKGWGGEDVDLFKKMVKYGIRVFRAMDPDLIHRYHSKSCDPSLTPDQKRMCMASLTQAIGSTRQLAHKMIDDAQTHKKKMQKKKH